MSKKHVYFRGLFVLVSMILFIALLQVQYGVKGSEVGSEIRTVLTAHDPISITSDSGFSEFNGTGTVDDPYLIANLEISASGSVYAIYISGTTKYFEIINCSLTGENVVMHIENVAEATATIINNSISLSSSHTLVKIYSSSNTTIINNTFSHGDTALSIQNSPNSLIKNNKFWYQTNTAGIAISGSSNSVITQNNFYDCFNGLELGSGTDMIVTTNTFEGCGIVLSDSMTLEAMQSTIFANNTINNSELGLFVDIHNETISAVDYAQLILINASDIVLSDLNITNVSNAISVYYSTNVSVANSVFNSVNYAIYGGNSDQIEFNYNTIDVGNIYFKQGDTVSIVNNSINLSQIHISISNDLQSMIGLNSITNVTVANNTIVAFDAFGIFVTHCNYATITNNYISDYTASGVALRYTPNAEISNNILLNLGYWHLGIGIDVYSVTANNAKIVNNIVIQNAIGIRIWYSTGFVIFNNSFVNSTTTNAESVGTGGNTWYDIATSTGNYWSDKNATGYYYISGSANEYDPYPMDLLDSDSDSLSDLLEIYAYGTNPSNADTDGDGLSDTEEVLNTNTDPSNADTDSDGLNDYDEVYTYPTDPFDNDTDDDGLSDGDEVLLYGSNPLLADSDSDGVSDFDEVTIWGTNPNNTDTDSDGLNDYYEIDILHSNPNSNDTDADGLSDYDEINTYYTNITNPDTDSDGLNDGEEVYTYHTNPLKADTDDDGLSDSEEINTYGTDPNNPDTDGDTYSDSQEINAGTDPNNPDDYPGKVETTSTTEANTKTIGFSLPLSLFAVLSLSAVLYLLKKR